MRKYANLRIFLHMRVWKLPIYAVKHAICVFLQIMRYMLPLHDRYKPTSLAKLARRATAIVLPGNFERKLEY